MPKGVYKRTEKQKEEAAERFREQARLKKGKKRVPFSNEAKKKMSIAKIGKKPWNFGKKGIYSDKTLEKIKIARAKQIFSQETRKKLSDSQKKRVEKRIHHFYKGGIYPLNLALRKTIEYKLWRESVFRRDNFSCVLCKSSKSGTLQADHIKSFSKYPDLRFCIENGRTLCIECHRKTENYGRQKN